MHRFVRSITTSTATAMISTTVISIITTAMITTTTWPAGPDVG
jgi:hypothetical protein